MGANLKIFTIYTSEDADAMYRVCSHLKSYQEHHKLSICQEDAIRKDQQWKPKVESNFYEADLFLLFLSNALMYSEFIQQLEFKMVIDRYKAGTAVVIPILLENCPWDVDFNSDDYNFSFKELHVLPEEAKPIKDWVSSEKAFRNVDASIKNVIQLLFGADAQDEFQNEEKSELNTSKTEQQRDLALNGETDVHDQKRLGVDVAAIKLVEGQKHKKEAKAKNSVEQEQRLREEKAAERFVKEKRLKEEIELKTQTEKQKKFEKKKHKKIPHKPNREAIKDEQVKDSGHKKRLVIGSLTTLLIIGGVWTFSVLNTGSEIDSKSSSNRKVVEIDAAESISLDTAAIEPGSKKEIRSELGIGDFHKEGIIFSFDADNKKGKIVHIEDAGPMTWENAFKIHEQLGEGWRLPTLDELKLLYKTVGQGATNSAKFSNQLYWSATPYDEYQARLLRFSDGNTNYHYNKEAEHRIYQVRAVRDFSR